MCLRCRPSGHVVSASRDAPDHDRPRRLGPFGPWSKRPRPMIRRGRFGHLGPVEQVTAFGDALGAGQLFEADKRLA